MAYSIETVREIILNKKYKDLEPDIIEIIENLTKQVSADGYKKIPNFDKKRTGNSRRSNHPNNVNWKSFRENNFEVTKRIESTGIDKMIENIRADLNKISSDTYTNITKSIYDNLSQVTLNDETYKFEKMIFLACIQNPIYSNLFAKLYYSLIKDFKKFNFKEILIDELETYCDKFEKIIDVSDTDYEKFCENNKNNSNIITFAKFATHMWYYIEDINIEGIVNNILKIFIKNIELENKSKICEELSNALYIIFKTGIDKIKDNPNWSKHILTIREISNIVPKSKKSFTSKILFKHYDIVDLL